MGKSFDDFPSRLIAVRMHKAALVGIILDVVMVEELIALMKEINNFGPMSFEFGGRGLLRHRHFGGRSIGHGGEWIWRSMGWGWWILDDC